MNRNQRWKILEEKTAYKLIQIIKSVYTDVKGRVWINGIKQRPITGTKALNMEIA